MTANEIRERIAAVVHGHFRGDTTEAEKDVERLIAVVLWDDRQQRPAGPAETIEVPAFKEAASRNVVINAIMEDRRKTLAFLREQMNNERSYSTHGSWQKRALSDRDAVVQEMLLALDSYFNGLQFEDPSEMGVEF